MTPDEAYEEALRRIREAEKTGAVELDLSGWNRTAQKYTGLETLTRLPPELKRRVFTSLQSLNLSGSRCSLQSLNLSGSGWFGGGNLTPLTSLTSLDLSHVWLSDLSPLARLTSLRSLNLAGCRQLSGDLTSLAGLTSLQSLTFSRCDQLSGDLAPLADLTSLQSLDLHGCDQLSGDLSPLARLRSDLRIASQTANKFTTRQVSPLRDI